MIRLCSYSCLTTSNYFGIWAVRFIRWMKPCYKWSGRNVFPHFLVCIWCWCAAVMLFPRYFCAVMLTYSVTRASNVWTQWNVVCSNYCILQRAELFLRINVCYECRCIFFHIFYTIVMFMKCCDFACTSHVYVGARAHTKNAKCAECKWPVSILSCFCYIIHWNIWDTFILEVFLALFALKWKHYIRVYNVLGSSGYSLH